ncbi:hypothetical protein [Aequorivita echinoideorum]|uniref:Addiction module component n=1 Tax=Aequorivita echinoideorum TaxID=1549647 RepID=A0ABS5S178_9FLAO|nr:hypothetical protein [Aequorivita echinoideorum]MBT0606964.1 hypothetical protein [Aequorivita echinoideorum]
MNLEARKIEFVKEFLKIQSEEVIAKLEKILMKESRFYSENNEFIPMTVEEFNDQIERSLEDSENNRVISAKDLKEEIKKWR